MPQDKWEYVTTRTLVFRYRVKSTGASSHKYGNDKRAVVIILSDDCDTEEPDKLADALAAMKKRAGKLSWLNSLMGSPAYQPLVRRM